MRMLNHSYNEIGGESEPNSDEMWKNQNVSFIVEVSYFCYVGICVLYLCFTM